MSRKIAAALAAAAVGAIALLMSLPATAAPTTVMGKVGPGYTISLTIGGKKVKKLKAGVKYRFVVADRSEDHDFRLNGPGTSKVLSGEGFRGTKVTRAHAPEGDVQASTARPTRTRCTEGSPSPSASYRGWRRPGGVTRRRLSRARTRGASCRRPRTPRCRTRLASSRAPRLPSSSRAPAATRRPRRPRACPRRMTTTHFVAGCGSTHAKPVSSSSVFVQRLEPRIVEHAARRCARSALPHQIPP